MRMIALILGWHFIAIGVVTAIFAISFGLISDMICAAISFSTGLLLAIKFRDTCASYRSDPPKPQAGERELDYY